MMYVLYGLIPSWLLPEMPMPAPIGIHTQVKDPEVAVADADEEDIPAVEVPIRKNGSPEVVEVPPELDAATVIQNMRQARAGVREVEGSLDVLIDKFRRKSEQMLDSAQKLKDPQNRET